MSYRHTSTRMISQRKKNILNKDEWIALDDLRKDDCIIITKPDKGKEIVIIN